MQTFVLRIIDDQDEAHNHILGHWYAAVKPGSPTFERIEKGHKRELEKGDFLLCIVNSSQANQTFLFKRTTKAAYVMLDNGSTFECLYSS